MANIKVGLQYKDEFESIVKLSEDQRLSDDAKIRRAYPGYIETEAHVYQLDSEDDRQSENISISMGKTGASWFAAVRGEQVVNNNGAWQELIEKVARSYHSHYSFLEYEHKKSDQSIRKEQLLVERFCKEVLGRIFTGITTFTPVADNGMPVNIYGLSLKLDVSGGVGLAEPVLCKVYFIEENGVLVPVKKEQAGKYEKFIGNVVPTVDDGAASVLNEIYGETVRNVFKALSRCIDDKPGEEDNDFTDFALFGKLGDDGVIGEDNVDSRKIKFMLNHLSNSEVKKLTCSKVEVLCVSHVTWHKTTYTVSYGGKDIIGITVGLDNSLDVRCLNCNGADSVLIESNTVMGIVNGKVEIKPSERNFGLTDVYVLEGIKKYSNFAKHLFTVDCSKHALGGCSRVVCQSQTFTVGDERRCKQCRHPEIVYVDIFDGSVAPRSTNTLVYASDKLEFVDCNGVDGEGKPFTCPCCHNTYSYSGSYSKGLCHVCANPDLSSEGRKKYRLYRKMLTIGTRLEHIGAKKSCKEYRNLIIFTLGGDKYVFDKLNVEDNGLLRAPSKYKRRGK